VRQPASVASRAPLAARTSGESVSAELLLANCVERLEHYASISAKIRQQGEIMGIRTLGSGIYLQGNPPSGLLRVELKIRADDELTSLQQICDGQFLWIFRKLGEESTLGRADALQVMQALQASPAPAEQGRAGEGSRGRPMLEIGIGGLPRMMRNIGRSFHFTQMAPLEWGSLPVYGLRGGWSPQALSHIVPEQAEAAAAGNLDWSRVPSQIPDEALLLLGRDNLFPYRIEYRRSSEHAAEGVAGGTLLVMELFDVQFNAPLERNLFRYQPGDLPVADLTGQYIERLRGM
jgi:hypothetical protein